MPKHPRRRTRSGLLLRRAIAITYRSDRAGFLRAAALQLFGSLSPSALVVIGKLLLDSLATPSHPGTHRHSEVVFIVVAILALITGATLAATNVQTQQQRVLGERAASEAWRDVLRKTATLPYNFFESPELFDRLQRIKTGAFTQQVAVTTAMFGMLGAFTGLFGLVAVLLALDPLLVPILLVAGVPSMLLSRRIAAAEGRFLEAGTPIFRGRDYLRTILTGRPEAKEIKTFNAHG